MVRNIFKSSWSVIAVSVSIGSFCRAADDVSPVRYDALLQLEKDASGKSADAWRVTEPVASIVAGTSHRVYSVVQVPSWCDVLVPLRLKKFRTQWGRRWMTISCEGFANSFDTPLSVAGLSRLYGSLSPALRGLKQTRTDTQFPGALTGTQIVDLKLPALRSGEYRVSKESLLDSDVCISGVPSARTVATYIVRANDLSVASLACGVLYPLIKENEERQRQRAHAQAVAALRATGAKLHEVLVRYPSFDQGRVMSSIYVKIDADGLTQPSEFTEACIRMGQVPARCVPRGIASGKEIFLGFNTGYEPIRINCLPAVIDIVWKQV